MGAGEVTGLMSASDRYEAARKALGIWDASDGSGWVDNGQRCIDALRALITPPGVERSEIEVAHRIVDANLPDRHMDWDDKEVLTVAIQAFRAGIQAAHETWEPEVALQPSREQMIRCLGLDFKESTDDEGEPSIYIHGQHIDRDEI